MRKYLNRILGTIVTLSIFISCVPIVFAEEETTQLGNTNMLWTETFEDGRLEFDWKREKSNFRTGLIEGDNGTSLLVTPGDGASKFIDKFEPVTDGILRISFDFRTSRTDEDNQLFYLSMINSKLTVPDSANANNQFHGLFITNQVDCTSTTSGFSRGSAIFDIESDRWYHIDVWADLEKRKIYYMFDGEIIGEAKLSDTMEDVAGVMFTYEGTTPCETYTDNIIIQHTDEAGAVELAKQGVTMPKVLYDEIAVSYDTGQIGNIYFDNEKQNMSLRLRNKVDKEQKLTLNYQQTYDGREQTIGSKDVIIAPFGEQVIELTFNGSKYGFYEVPISILKEDGTPIVDVEPLRYSVAKIPPEGVDNNKLGVNFFLREWQTSEGEFFGGLELADKVGFSFIRSCVDMQDYDADHPDGQSGFKIGWHQKAFEELEKRGMGIPFLLSRNNYDGPQTEGFSEKFSAYAAGVINDPLIAPITNELTTLNEPDLSSARYTVEQYVPFVENLYNEIKKANSDAFVWGPVIAGMENSTWLEKFMELGGGAYVDGFDIHGYTLKTTPEGGSLISTHQKIKELFEKYGYGDKPVYKSEFGWTSVGEDGYSDEYQQSYYNIRLLILNDYYEFWDKAASYAMIDRGLNNEQEHRFGVVKSYAAEIPLEAKPLYLTYGNYNSIMTGATFNERVELTPDVPAYKYTLADGRDCVVVWSISGKADQSIHLGVDSVKLVDSYGNEETLYSIDGDFMMSLSEEPVYLIGDFDTVTQGTNLISTDKNKGTIVAGDCTELTLNKKVYGDFNIEIDLPDNLNIEKNDGFQGDKARIILRSMDAGVDREQAIIKVTKDGKLVYKTIFILEYSNPVEIKVYSKPYSLNQLNHWQIVFEVTSNNYSETNSGVIRFKAPNEIASKVREIKVPTILPGQSRTIKINIPTTLTGQEIHILADVEMEKGGITSVDAKVSADGWLYAGTKPVIDGVLEAEVWRAKSKMKMQNKGVTGEEYRTLITTESYGGDEDLSADAYMMWDEENFYLALEVTDDVYAYDTEGEVYWKSDGIQIAIAPDRESDNDVMSVGIAEMNGRNDIQLEKSTYAMFEGPIEHGEMAVVRDEEKKITTYEICIPWQDLYPSTDYSPKGNETMVFSILINDNDGTGRHGYLEYGTGIAKSGKRPTDFRPIYMSGKK